MSCDAPEKLLDEIPNEFGDLSSQQNSTGERMLSSVTFYQLIAPNEQFWLYLQEN